MGKNYNKKKYIIKKYKLYFLLFACLLFVISYFVIGGINHEFLVAEPHAGLNRGIVYDSKLYYDIVHEKIDKISDFLPYFIINKNIIPPSLIFYLCGEKLEVLYLFYFVSYLMAILFILKYIKDKRTYVLMFFLLYPVVFGYLYGPNKAIAGLISNMFLVVFLLSNKKKFLFFVFLYALFTRYELLLVELFFLITIKSKNKKRYIYFSFLLFLLSYAKANFDYSQIILLKNQTSNSMGFTLFLDNLSSKGFHFIIFPIKAMLNLYSKIFIFKGNGLNSLFLSFSNWLFIILTLLIIKKKLLTINNNFVYYIFIFLATFTVPAYIDHRYFIPIYPFFIYVAILEKRFKA